jgi:hypothetical protein
MDEKTLGDLRSSLAFSELLRAGATSGAKLFGSVELRHGIAEITPEVIGTATTEWTKQVLKGRAASELVAAVASQSLGVALKHMAGPLLTVWLHVTDKTQEKLDRLIAAPMISGLAMANRALALPCVKKADLELQRSMLQSSIKELERAGGLCDPTDRWSRYYIRAFQGLMSFKLKADVWGYSYLEQCVPLLDEQRVCLWKEMRDQKELAKRLLTPRNLELAANAGLRSVDAFCRALATEGMLHGITKGDMKRRIDILVAHDLAKQGIYKTATGYRYGPPTIAA